MTFRSSCHYVRRDARFQVWHSIGSGVTEPPPPGGPSADVFVPSQPFLTALVQIFPGMFQHIKYRSVLALWSGQAPLSRFRSSSECSSSSRSRHVWVWKDFGFDQPSAMVYRVV